MFFDRHMKDDWDNFPVQEEDAAIGARIWKKVHRRVLVKKYWGGVVSAAIVSAAASIVIFVSVYVHNDNEVEAPAVQTVEILAETNREVVLPDGSVVYLDAGSSLSYPETMAGSRSVALSGNAVFDIKKTADNQNFIVNVEASYIEVRGTSFAVSTEAGKEVSVVLYSGAVDFVSTSNGQSVSLKPSNKLSFNISDQTINVSPSFPGITWIDGAFLIKDAPLSSLADFINWKYDVDVCLDSSVDSSLRTNGVIRYKETCGDVISKICYMFDLRCEYDSGTYRLTRQ